MLGLVGTGILIGTWAVISGGGVVASSSLPGPVAVARRVVDLLTDGDYWTAMQDTMWTWVLSLLLVGATAVPLGLVIGQVRPLFRPVNTAVSAFRSIPATALLPVAILTFKLGYEMKLALTYYAIFWPVLINSIYGSINTDPLRLDVARSLRWSRWRRFTRVVLPSAAPMVATGIRIASGTALVVVLSAELLGATKGIGVTIRVYQQSERTDFVYAGIALVGVLGTLLYTSLVHVEKRMLRWVRV
jgi:NitT/TauT family transport system permease protein